MGMRKTPNTSEAGRRVESALSRGRAREAIRKKYAHLSLAELNRESHRMAIESARLLALFWERSDSHPAGN